MRMSRYRWASPAVAVAILVALGIFSAVIASNSPSDPNNPPDTTPEPPEYQYQERPTTTFEDEVQAREETRRNHPGQFIPASGPGTAGSKIYIAGKEVQLPADVIIKRFIVSGVCTAGQPCPETPIYELQRGNSIIGISALSGAIVEGFNVAAEDGAFDFLKEVLK
jgi:hypothetical protein